MHERSAVGSPTALVYSLQASISFACSSRVLCIVSLNIVYMLSGCIAFVQRKIQVAEHATSVHEGVFARNDI